MRELCPQDIAHGIRTRVIEPVANLYPGKRELVELIALAFCSSDHLLIVGPPGTAKSEVAAEMCSRIDGRYFEYLLTRFTEPSEVFGPTDIAALRQGELRTHVQGMLPEAEVAFLDEIFHAGSAILNTLLGVLNDRVYRRGQQTLTTPLVSVIAASNHLAEDPTLRALQDRFTLRVEVNSLANNQLASLLKAGWKLEQQRLAENTTNQETESQERWSVEHLRCAHELVARVDLSSVLDELVSLVEQLRATGMFLSDRRVVKLQRLVAASTVLCGRSEARTSDLWPARYLWETEEDREDIEVLVDRFLAEHARTNPSTDSRNHPLAHRGRLPADLLAALGDLEAEIHMLPNEAKTESTETIHERLFDLDRQRRWCHPFSDEDRSLLRELEEKLDSLSATLDGKSASS